MSLFSETNSLNQSKDLKNLKKSIVYVLSFFIPFILITVIYALFGVYPFGEKTVLTFDLNTQFSIFHDYFRRVLLGEESLFYSFSKGMGGNMYSLFTYYLSSPFSLLMILFPQERLPEGIALILALKIACAGLTFSIFLKNVFNKSDLSVVLFSCFYALSGYIMKYSICIMWIDGIIWLPIILLGVERILKGNSGLLFVFSYAVSMCSNYYTGYMNTIFIVIYFFARYFALTEKTDKKELLNKTLKMLLWGIIGLLISAAVLLPSFLDIMNGKITLDKSASKYVESFINRTIENLPRHLFIGQFDSLEQDGNPPIFTSMLSGLMISIYLFNPKIKRREKVSTIAVFAVLFVSFFVTSFDTIWHIFQRPHGAFMYRYAYVFSFFTIMTAFRSFVEIKNIPRKNLLGALLLFGIILIDRILFKNDALTNKPLVILSLLVATIYALGITAPLYLKKNIKNIICLLLLVVASFELVIGGVATMKSINEYAKYKPRYEYDNYLKEIGEISEYIETRDDDFCRWDKTFHYTRNDSLMFGYSSATSFTSTFNGNLINKFRQFGMLNDVFTTQYDGSTLLTDSLFGLNYIVSKKPVNNEYREIKTIDGHNIYKNPYALPLAFATKNDVLRNTNYTESFFENQGLFASAVLGGNYAFKNEILETDTDSVLDKKNLENIVDFVAERNGIYYLSIPDKYVGSFSVTINGEKTNYPYDSARKRIFYLGNLAENDTVRVYFNNEHSKDELEVYCFDAENFKADCQNIISKPTFKITEMKNTYVKGKAKLSAGEVLFTTIPYEKGWRAYANGKEVKVLAAQDAFLALDLGAGEYEIELKYSVPALNISLVISLATLLGVIIYAIFSFIKRKQNKSA